MCVVVIERVAKSGITSRSLTPPNIPHRFPAEVSERWLPAGNTLQKPQSIHRQQISY